MTVGTDELILTLAEDAPAVPRRAVERRLVIGFGVGAIVTLVMVAALLGLRQDLAQAMLGPALWMKWGYTGSLAVFAILAVRQLSRPEAVRPRWLWLLLVPVGLLGVAAIVEMASHPRGDWLTMWLGRSWRLCPLLLFLFAAPIFAGLSWSFRALAPTRLRLTGAIAGLAAGAGGAVIYCLHCPEVSAMFVLTWYNLGILLATAAGALLGPRLLRW